LGVAKNDNRASVRELLLSSRLPLLQVLMYRSSEPLSVNVSVTEVMVMVMVMVMVSLPLLLLCASCSFFTGGLAFKNSQKFSESSTYFLNLNAEVDECERTH